MRLLRTNKDIVWKSFFLTEKISESSFPINHFILILMENHKLIRTLSNKTYRLSWLSKLNLDKARLYSLNRIFIWTFIYISHLSILGILSHNLILMMRHLFYSYAHTGKGTCDQKRKAYMRNVILNHYQN